MNRGLYIFLGAFATFAAAWVGLALAPAKQMANLGGDAPAYTELELKGREVYAAEGCVYCHTQQIRGGKFNADVNREWGRRSLPQDYVRDRPVLLGTMRIGPDLANVASRQTSTQWHHLHLYNPQKMMPGSTMSPFRFLYVIRKIDGHRSPEALMFDKSWTAADGAPPDGFEVVPTGRAKALVAYLMALKQTREAMSK